MERTRKRAIAWIVGCAFYSAAALIMSIAWGWSWAAAFIPLVGMTGMAACFELGRVHRAWTEYEEPDEDELTEAMASMEAATGVRVMKCKRCNGMAFRMVAGRFVCNFCGDVLEEDHGEKET